MYEPALYVTSNIMIEATIFIALDLGMTLCYIG